MKTTMKFIAACVAAALPFVTVSFPVTAATKSADAAYCSALSKAYRDTVPKTQMPTAAVPVAMDKCAEGDTADGIPVLEQALKDEGMTLPPRG
jgi:hypothetical protein